MRVVQRMPVTPQILARCLTVFAMLVGCAPRPLPIPIAASPRSEPPSNIVAVTVDRSSRGVNVPAVTVTVCVPNTTTCQTIPHIELDTASTGLRVYADALKLDLAAETDAHGDHIMDCAWIHWGSIHTADVKLAGLTAQSIPIQVIDTTSPRPPACGVDHERDPDRFNGILGVSPALTDTMPTAYFHCDDHHCVNDGVDTSLQLANVIARLPTDNNGCILQFPDIADAGTSAVTGRMILGIGTRANNQAPNDLIKIVVDEPWGQFKVQADGRTWKSAFDSGTWAYNVPYLSDERCPSDQIRLCPSAPTTIPVDVLAASGDVAYKTSIAIANASLAPPQAMALNNLGSAWPGKDLLILGLPYFFGRSIYYAYDHRSTTLGPGPWVAAR
jgi:hypothetical protein